uniref:Uncharacterized protein n=1 Tax=uncultured marine virus TaxID=186617 RepID=A0A0F7L9W8_9VIRU|nr:hypothetical protein [uncultured marine virus]
MLVLLFEPIVSVYFERKSFEVCGESLFRHTTHTSLVPHSSHDELEIVHHKQSIRRHTSALLFPC